MFTLPLAIVALLTLALVLDGYSPKRTPYGLALALWSGLRFRVSAARDALRSAYRAALVVAHTVAGMARRRVAAVAATVRAYRVEIRVVPRNRRAAGRRRLAVNVCASGISATIDSRPVIDTRDRSWRAGAAAAMDRRLARSNARGMAIAIVLGTWLLPAAMMGG